MKVLITGIAGHIGSKLAEYALEQGTEVHGIDDLSCGYADNVDPRALLIEQPVEKGLAVLDGLGQRFDAVFHCAAYAAEVMSHHVRAFNYRNNVVSTAHVVNYCCKTGARLVYFSSAAVYGAGSGLEPPFSEDDVCVPADPYGVAKLACEMDVRIAAETHGLRYCILRPHNVYGPGQSIWQRYRNVFGIWFARLFQGLPIQVFGDGQQRRAFSYIGDVIPATWAAKDVRSGEVINVGGAAPCRVAYAAEIFSRLFGCAVEHLPARHEVKDSWCTIGKSVDLLGYDDKTPLEVGLVTMHDWALEAWSQFPERRAAPRIGDGVELAERMPESWREQIDGA